MASLLNIMKPADCAGRAEILGTPITSGGTEIPIANIYYLLCYAWDVLEEKKTLVNGTRRLLRRGLDRGYIALEDEILGVRGKLLVTQTLCRNLLPHGRAACAWDDLKYDTLPNRILKTTLLQLHDVGELDMDTQADVHDLLRWLAPVQDMELRVEYFRRVQLHRNNRIYVFLLHICEFIHQHWLPAEHGGARRFRDFLRDNLPALFENFVFNFYRQELGCNWQVSSPWIHWQMSEANADARAFVPHMRTDVCLRGPECSFILDTKFYAQALKEGVYGSVKLPSGNLYQLYTYLSHKAVEEGWQNAEGILLYPRTNKDFDIDFITHGHRVRATILDLFQPWRRIHDRLLDIVRST
jgi:5-methylcytosine-specific restriction enzyme subunit McrC